MKIELSTWELLKVRTATKEVLDQQFESLLETCTSSGVIDDEIYEMITHYCTSSIEHLDRYMELSSIIEDLEAVGDKRIVDLVVCDEEG